MTAREFIDGADADAGEAAYVPDALERRLLDAFQRDFPLEAEPYRRIAERLGTDEVTVLAALERLRAAGAIARVGATLAPHRVGWSTLAAMAVPGERLEEVAALVSAFDEVNHNYEREHAFNLWFVVTAPDEARVGAVLDAIRAATGIDVLDLPLEEPYRLDLGFPLRWT